MKPAKVLFVCVENSCRSQVAEGFARKLGAGLLEAHSAGSKPSGRVNPLAVELMGELGVDISKNASKGLWQVPEQGWDYVITMGCGDACPFVPAKAKRDWALPDPKNLPREQFLAVIREIERRVTALIDEIQAGAR
jgi:arsenate reductase